MRYAVKQDAVVWQQVDDEVVYLDLATSEYQSVNASGAALWAEMAAPVARERLAAVLVERFAVDQATADTDVDRFLDDLRARGLLVAE